MEKDKVAVCEFIHTKKEEPKKTDAERIAELELELALLRAQICRVFRLEQFMGGAVVNKIVPEDMDMDHSRSVFRTHQKIYRSDLRQRETPVDFKDGPLQDSVVTPCTDT